MYSTERVVAKFEQLVGRTPSETEIQEIKSSQELLSIAVAHTAKIDAPKQLIASGAHCKSCDD